MQRFAIAMMVCGVLGFTATLIFTPTNPSSIPSFCVSFILAVLLIITGGILGAAADHCNHEKRWKNLERAAREEIQKRLDVTEQQLEATARNDLAARRNLAIERSKLATIRRFITTPKRGWGEIRQPGTPRTNLDVA